ncbi:MAG: hypothetical protein P4L53_04215 [Candidatus Obscuribacterales bacterium]|nr:hypothetical protein [Candidatus Obscuribacterales bacterium]
MRHVCNRSPKFRSSNHSAKLAICSVTVAFISNGVANAQPSDSPPRAKHHFLPPDLIMLGPGESALSAGYAPVSKTPVSRTVKRDPTLSFISADEPIVQAGFPPLPRRADMPGSDNPAPARRANSVYTHCFGPPVGYTPSAPITKQSTTPNLALPDEFGGTNKNNQSKGNRTGSGATNGTIHF